MKFIQLTDVNTGINHYVNTSHIIDFAQYDNVTAVIFNCASTNGGPYSLDVQESSSEILALIEGKAEAHSQSL